MRTFLIEFGALLIGFWLGYLTGPSVIASIKRIIASYKARQELPPPGSIWHWRITMDTKQPSDTTTVPSDLLARLEALEKEVDELRKEVGKGRRQYGTFT